MIGGCALNHGLEKVHARGKGPCAKCGMSVRGGCAWSMTLAGPLYVGSIPALNPTRLGPRASPDREDPILVQLGLVSTGIDPMCRGPASLKGPLSLLSQQSKQLYRD